MHYTAIIKDGGLFIPNVFTELDDGQAHIVQVEIDMEAVRQQLKANEAPDKATLIPPKKQIKTPSKSQRPQSAKKQKIASEAGFETPNTSAVDELEALDDAELSEILKAYINDGFDDKEAPVQISLEDL